MRSLRTRLLALWLMLAVSGTVTGLLLLEFYRQSANAQVTRAQELVDRSCRELSDRYAAVMSGWRGDPSRLDKDLRGQLTRIAQAAFVRASGVEGGIWQASHGSLAYAYPTYEGTGPKTDVPEAELPTIRSVNAEALRTGRPATVQQIGRSQVLVVHGCPLSGPLGEVTAWTMTRVFTGQGRAYNQLLAGLALLALTVFGSALWLGYILVTWSRKLKRLEGALADHDVDKADLPTLPPTGELELDRLVGALNAVSGRLADARRRAAAAERLAALGRWAAGLAHEIRNPIAAMRLKAENALAAVDEGRRISALKSVLEQVGRLDALLRDLMATTQPRPPRLVETDLRDFLEETIESHREPAAARGVRLECRVDKAPTPPTFDVSQMRSALDNLILNAIQNTPSGGAVTVEASRRQERLCLRVRDTGPGVPDDIREHLFEPFVTGRAGGTGLAERMQQLLAPGAMVTARGSSLTTSLGTVIDVTAIGNTPDQLTELAVRPPRDDGPRGPAGPRRAPFGPADFGPPPRPPRG
jgi:signal transduction histidine kinase